MGLHQKLVRVVSDYVATHTKKKGNYCYSLQMTIVIHAERSKLFVKVTEELLNIFVGGRVLGKLNKPCLPANK